MSNMIEERVEWMTPWGREGGGRAMRGAKAIRVVRQAPEQLVHRWRHRRAVRRLQRTSPVGRFVFVCYGNLCRSPYAEAAFRSMLGGVGRTVVRVVSAGFGSIGRSAPVEAQAAAAARGVELAEHRSRRVSADLVASAALVVAMDPEQARRLRREFRVPGDRVFVLGDLDPNGIETRGIRDPMNGSRDVFEASYGRIDRCLRTLARAIGVWEGARAGSE